MADQPERIRHDAPLSDIWDAVERDGAVIVERLITADIIDRLNAELDAPLNGITAGARKPSSTSSSVPRQSDSPTSSCSPVVAGRPVEHPVNHQALEGTR